MERNLRAVPRPPFGTPKLRAVENAQNTFDWNVVPIPALAPQPYPHTPPVENIVESHLLKWVHFAEDNQGTRKLELRYFATLTAAKWELSSLRTANPCYSRGQWAEMTCSCPKFEGTFPTVALEQISMSEPKIVSR